MKRKKQRDRVVSVNAFLAVVEAMMRRCRYQRERDFVESLAMAALELVRTRGKNASRSSRGVEKR